jgi:hypothetical protein
MFYVFELMADATIEQRISPQSGNPMFVPRRTVKQTAVFLRSFEQKWGRKNGST